MDFRFARRPAWIVSHALVLMAIVTMISLGLWQLSRLDERKATNEQIVSRSDQPVEPMSDLVNGRVVGDTGDLDWRVATATGTYAGADQVLVVNRSLDGAAGAWVLTPLVVDDGSAIVVNRGWVPFAVQTADERSAIDPPQGEVEVVGLVQSTQRRGRIGAGDPDDPDLLARVDLEAYAQLVDHDIAGAYLQLETQAPPVDGLPIPVPRPELSNGPHLSYAVQWFIFTTILLIGYPLALRKLAKS